MNGKISYSLRTAGVEDAATITDLGRRTFAATFSGENDPGQIKAYMEEAFSSEQILSELNEPDSSYLLVMDGERIAGYGKIKPGKRPQCVNGVDAAELERIYVDGPWLGKGAGEYLLKALLAKAKDSGYRSVWLGVWEHNPRAIRFYEKYGFAVVGDKSFLLGGDKQVDLVMFKRLD